MSKSQRSWRAGNNKVLHSDIENSVFTNFGSAANKRREYQLYYTLYISVIENHTQEKNESRPHLATSPNGKEYNLLEKKNWKRQTPGSIS